MFITIRDPNTSKRMAVISEIAKQAILEGEKVICVMKTPLRIPDVICVNMKLDSEEERMTAFEKALYSDPDMVIIDGAETVMEYDHYQFDRGFDVVIGCVNRALRPN